MSVLLVLFGLLGTTLPVPYVAQVPGPIYNTLGDIDGEPIIEVEGRDPNEVQGNLNLTTVGVSRGGLSLVQAVRGWFDDEVSVVPEESVYPPDRSEEETRQANREAFLTSEQAGADRRPGAPRLPVKVVVQGLAEDSPSEGALEEGDALEAVDGGRRRTPTRSTTVLDLDPRRLDDHRRLHAPRAAGHRDGHHHGPPSDGRPLLGITVLEQPSAPFDVDIQVEDVGGPSAGLMLTLGILDLVGDDDLTGGAVVAGTGTIDARERSGRSAGSR